MLVPLRAVARFAATPPVAGGTPLVDELPPSLRLPAWQPPAESLPVFAFLGRLLNCEWLRECRTRAPIAVSRWLCSSFQRGSPRPSIADIRACSRAKNHPLRIVDCSLPDRSRIL